MTVRKSLHGVGLSCHEGKLSATSQQRPAPSGLHSCLGAIPRIYSQVTLFQILRTERHPDYIVW